MNDRSLPPLPGDLRDFEAELAGLTPNFDRLAPEQVCFEAGRAAERRRHALVERETTRHRPQILSLAASFAAGLAIAWLAGLTRGGSPAGSDSGGVRSDIAATGENETELAPQTGRSNELATRGATASPAPRFAPERDAVILPLPVAHESPWMRKVREATSERLPLPNFDATPDSFTDSPLAAPLEPPSPAERIRNYRRQVERAAFDDLT